MTKDAGVLVGTGAAISVLGLIVALVPPGLVQSLDLKAFDSFAAHAGPGEPSTEVAIVEIDEGSLQKMGRWPWPRAALASLISRIQDAGAAVVALDIIFPEANAEPAATLSSIGPSPEAESAAALSNDAALAAVLRRGRVVLGTYAQFTQGFAAADCHLHPLVLVERGDASSLRERLPRPHSVVCNIDELARSASSSGFLNVSPDEDGILRRTPLLFEYEGNLYPSFALASLLAHRSIPAIQLEHGFDGSLEIGFGDAGTSVNRDGSLLFRLRGPARSTPHFAAAALIEGPLPDLTGKIVIVGGTAAGLHDSLSTARSPSFTGIEVHATSIANLLTGDGYRRPPLAKLAELISVLLCGLGATLLLWRARGLVTIVLFAGALGAAIWGVSGVLLDKTGVFVSPVLAVGTLLSTVTALSLLVAFQERNRAAAMDLQLESARQLMVGMLAHLTEIRDQETGMHLLRMQRYSRVLCAALATREEFRSTLSPQNIELITLLVPIHDIGKVGVPQEILRKPGRLTGEEYEQIKLHVNYGRDVLLRAREFSIVVDDQLFQFSHDIIYCHHERWDGTGYPRGLQGNAIPLVGRVVALVDVYDALVNERAYKVAYSHAQAVELIVEGQGTQFDPEVVAAFLEVMDRFQQISADSKDSAKWAPADLLHPEDPGVATRG